MRISITETDQFDTCLRQWDYSSPNRQNLSPVVPSAPLVLGSAVHKGLESYYTEGGRDPVEAFRDCLLYTSPSPRDS